MNVLMRSFLLSISMLVCSVALWAQTPLLQISGKRNYRVTIAARGAELTGICIIKTDTTGSRGAVVNEFGIHALDFTLSPDRKKVKLLNVMPAMNRWYIKRVVRGDLKFLFGATQNPQRKGKRTVTVDADSTLTLVNSKYGLKYSFQEIDNQDDETTE